MLHFHRTPKLCSAQLEPMNDLWVSIPDDELCQVMPLCKGLLLQLISTISQCGWEY
jgi:hypothetical protein